MAISLSTGLRNYLLKAGTDGSFADAFHNTTARIVIYSGTVPTSADDAVTGNILAIIGETDGTYGGGQTALTFNSSHASSGALTKSTTATWLGDIIGAGTQTATFWRLCLESDYTGSFAAGAAKDADPAELRIQGTIGTSGADGNLSSTSLANGGTQYIDYFSIGIPAS